VYKRQDNYQAQWAPAEVQGPGVGNQLLQRSPFEGYGEAAAQLEQVELQAVGVGDHGQAGDGAFSGFGLEYGSQRRKSYRNETEFIFRVTKNN